MDEKLLELYKVLKIGEADYPPVEQIYDNHTPFKKCSATIDIPTTIGNATTFLQPRLEGSEDTNGLSNR
jgi:hypothetical protein